MAAEAAIGAAVGAVMEEIVKEAAPSIKRRLNYLCCFTSNINKLEEGAKELDDAAAVAQGRVGRALANAEVILPPVETLLDKHYKGIKDKKTTILDQVPNVGSVCLNLRARYSLSKTAVETTDRMKVLQDECKRYSNDGTPISEPRPHPAREAVISKDAYEFGSRNMIEEGIMTGSRNMIEEGIMTVLRGGDVCMIGICGMGGLGKTTMAKRIMNRVLKENVFKETVIAVVSEKVDKHRIQVEIGGQLGLTALKDEPSEAVKNQHARQSDTEKILLVLDDVWKPIELEDFGIPHDSKLCTILITSRNRDTLHGMNAKEFKMKVLPEDEARFLFREKAGTCVDDDELKSTAEAVMKECGELPLALGTHYAN